MAKAKTTTKPVKIDPSITHSLTLGWPMLEDTLHAIASSTGDKVYDYAMQALWLAEKLGPEIAAAHENAEAVDDRDRRAEDKAA